MPNIIPLYIYCYNKKIDDLIGGDENNYGVKTLCYIDTNQVSSVWQDPDEGICIHLLSGEKYYTSTYTIEEFVEIWGSRGKPKAL